MTRERPILMIPGPVETSPKVILAGSGPTPGHLSAQVMEAFAHSLPLMRRIWCAASDSQPFIIAGSGTLAMEMAAANLIEKNDHALVLNTGYFSSRKAEILRRLGAQVDLLESPVGSAPSVEETRQALKAQPYKALFVTHVDTSTGVLVDPQPLARLAREHDVLSVFDGVCATAGERFDMAEWGADVYYTGSQKAIGMAPGLALLMATPRALQARSSLKHPPPMYLDWAQWLPIMQAYEQGQPSYFATPATHLVVALHAALAEIAADELGPHRGIAARVVRHQQVAHGMQRAWQALGLSNVPQSQALCANTMSALRFPKGIDGTLIKHIAHEGVVVAGGLHPDIKAEYFRIGHMGFVTTQKAMLARTIGAVAKALQNSGAAIDAEGAVQAAMSAMESYTG